MTEFAREYGEGLYDLAAEEKLMPEILTQLRVLRSAFDEQREYISLLSNRAFSLEERIKVIDDTFSGRVNEYVLNFMKILCGRDAMHEFGRCVQVFEEHFNADNRVSAAVVTTAKPLTETQRTNLIARLEKMTGHAVVLTEKTDAALIGGLMLEMDGKRWDNSLKQRLESVRKQISGIEQ